MLTTDHAKPATPLIFGPAERRCFGWFHPPGGPSRNTGVVLCCPLGYEGACAYETVTKLAEYLASAGFAVLRFDYHGTGDSTGSDADPARVAAWLGSIEGAIDEVARLGQVAQVSLFGVRAGALLAARAASLRGGVSSLVMWAPCVTGRSFARELRAAALLRAEAPAQAVGMRGRDIEALGYLYQAQTLDDLGALDLLALRPLPAERVLMVGRDDLPHEGALPAAWRRAGAHVTYRELPGFSAMMVDVHHVDVAHDTLREITAWLCERHPVLSIPSLRAAVASQVTGSDHAASDTSVLTHGVREHALTFGGEHRLFGILSEPEVLSVPSDPRSQLAILMLNIGTNHRVGPNRLYVKMARRWAQRGYRALRFDLAGIGDSGSAATFSATRLYDKASVSDVQLAMDSLRARGCTRFIVMGLCSGAYVAFQTALVDERVIGQVLMNPRRLAWKGGDTLQGVMAKNYKSTSFYTHALRDPSTYQRLVLGQIDVRGILGRMRDLARARVLRLSKRLLREPAADDLLAHLKALCARGADSLFIVAAEDDGLDYLQFHLGTRGRRMRAFPSFRMSFVQGSDHTFSRIDSQERVIAMVLEHLDRLMRQPPMAASPPPDHAQSAQSAQSARPT